MPVIIKNLDKMLGTSVILIDSCYPQDSFLLGVGLRDARRKAKEVGGDESNFLFNAKNQITLWGPHGEINDYSTRQWNGVVGDYHFHRWTEYLKTVEMCVKENRTLSLGDYHERMMQFGYQWDKEDGAVYPEKPVGDCIVVGNRIYDKYLNRKLTNYQEVAEVSVKEEDIYFSSMSRNPSKNR